MRSVKLHVAGYIGLLGICASLAPSLHAQATIQFQPRGPQSTTLRSAPPGNSSEATRSNAHSNAISADLLAIYQQTQAAIDEAAVTAIARACAKVIPDSQRSRVDRDYAAELFAWALNRRGEIRNERAAQLVEQGDLEQAGNLDLQAAKDFETALQYNPNSWRTHHNLGISLAMKGDYARAIKQFSASIELKPDYSNSHFNRGELYFELAQYPEAISDYTQAIELAGTDPQYYNSRGHCHLMLAQYDAALADYQQATQLASDSAVYATDLADAYQFLGRWEEAATTYRQAVAINSQYPRAYQNAAWLMATCPEAKFRNVNLALSAANKALELSGERSAHTLDTLAAATAATGNHREAVRLQQEALRVASQEEKPELSQRLALYQRGQSFVQSQGVLHVDKPAASQSSRIRTASGVSRPAR